MKYYTLDMINRFNDSSQEVRKQAEKEWDRKDEIYWNDFKTYQNRFSKKFLHHYLSHGFHDYRLEKIEILRQKGKNSKKEKTNVSIILSNYKNATYQILLKNVTSVNISFDITADDEWEVTFLYSEIFPVNDEISSIEILFSNEGTLKVHFKSIMVNNMTGKIKSGDI